MKNLSRRDLCKLVLRSSGSLAILSSLPAKAGEPKSSVFGGLEIGVQSYSFRGMSLEKALQTAVDLGVSSMELCDFCHLSALKASDDEFKSCRKRFEAAGVKISAYAFNPNLKWTDQQIERGFEGARLLGTKVITASTLKEIVPRIDKIAQKFKIFVGLHNHWFNPPDPRQFQSPEDFEWVLKGFSKWMSVNLDVGHFYAAGYDPVKFFQERYPRIVSLHLKERGNDPKHTECPFGQGSTPLIPVLKAAQKVHFKYAANIEWEVRDSDPAKGVAEALAYLKKSLG
jgi:sugar phosphate isomerase/epimerase